MIVKRCTKGSLDEVYKIEEAAFSDPLKKETMAKDMERESYYCYALFGDAPKAFISYEKVFDEGQIISVATHPCCRRQGYAKTLFEEVLSLAKQDGIALFTLEVRSDNLAALELYKSLGFKEVGVRKNYYQSPLCDAILMDLHTGDEI
ncbi:MAG: ribosomal protein S18-alanine N-acetyltransferase [Clostridia bacterium]|nr:ribosomal protein S18-alanine N-acetyltransferase [Clostridia bacterium]